MIGAFDNRVVGSGEKILVVAFDTSDPGQAVSRRLTPLIERLLAQKYRVTVLGACPASTSKGFEHIEPKVSLRKTHRGALSRLFNEFILGIECFLRLLFLPRQDLIIISSPPFVSSVFAVLACWLTKHPYIFDMRDRYPNAYFELGLVRSDGWIASVLRSLEKVLLVKAKANVCVTESMGRRLVVDYQIANMHVVRNGYHNSLGGHGKDQSVDTTAKKFTIIIHGNFGRFFCTKSFRYFALAMAEKATQPYRILMVGGGSNFDSPALDELPFVEKIRELGVDQIDSMLLGADMGLSLHLETPAMIDAFPVKVYEYIGANLPSVIVPISEAGRTVNQRKLGISVCSTDIDTAVTYVVSLMSDSLTYERVKTNVSEVSSDFSRAVALEKYIGVIGATLSH